MGTFGVVGRGRLRRKGRRYAVGSPEGLSYTNRKLQRWCHSCNAHNNEGSKESYLHDPT